MLLFHSGYSGPGNGEIVEVRNIKKLENPFTVFFSPGRRAGFAAIIHKLKDTENVPVSVNVMAE